MALTDPEREIVSAIFFEEIEKMKPLPNGLYFIANFFDLTKLQQMNQLKTRVQAKRDALQTAILGHAASAAEQEAHMIEARDILDGLLLKL